MKKNEFKILCLFILSLIGIMVSIALAPEAPRETIKPSTFSQSK